MTLSDVSIKNPVFAWMLMTGLIVFGWISFGRMGISQLPDVDFPIVNVRVTLEGAAPEVMETEVTDTIEDALMGIEGIREVSSSSRQGQSSINIEFELNRDIDVALQDVQTKISQAQRNLPAEIDPPVITKTNPEDQPIMFVALTGTRPTKDLMEFTKDQLKDRFTTLPGVGDVFLGGYIEPALRVWLDKEKMRQRELTVDDLIDTIQTQHAEVPAGRIETAKRELNVRVMGEAGTVDEFSKITIPGRQGAPIWKTFRIGDVAEVEDGLDEIRRISRSNGDGAVGLGIRKRRGANAVAVAQEVRRQVEMLRKDLPKDFNLNVVFDTTKFIEAATRELNLHLVMAAILTGMVCWLFLGSWSSTLNILLAIPVSIVGAFTVLYFLGFTLNTFTLLGLTLAIGIVVDDAIMVLENIVRYREMGFSKVKAAIVGARQITSAAIAATIAILAIFIPVIFMPGIVGRFLYQFGVTMSVAVSLSLVEALTIAPMRCSQFLQVGHTTRIGRALEGFMDRLSARYGTVLAWVLDHRWPTVITALVIFALSLGLGRAVKKEFVPTQDQGRLIVRIQTPVGSSLAFTDSVFKLAEEKVRSHPAVARYFAAVGGFGGGETDAGNMFITLKEPKERPIDPALKRRPKHTDIMQWARKELNQVSGIQRAVVQDPSQQGFSSQRGFPVEATVLGRDWDTLARLSETYQEKMKASGLMVDVDTDYRLGQPEVRVLPDRTKAAARGVSIQSIGNAINATIGGVRVGKYTRGGRRYDIRVRLVGKDRSRPEDIDSIWVRNNRGEVIPLSQVVQLKEQPSLSSINRLDRQRAIRVYANVAPGKSQGEALTAMKAIAKEILPSGYRMIFTGSAKTFGESNQGLIFVFILGIFTAYMVLASQYNSFIHPVTVLIALPFSLTGALIALWLGGQTINLYSIIGIILLAGIVKKNSILLVDFANEARRTGKSARDAMLEAGPVRLRPILMTSIATISAAIPSALAVGAGSETVQPMAQAVIGGVIISTLLTLIVVPAAYSLFSRLEGRKHQADLQEALKELGEHPV
ncbi:MAG: acriflavine resistance protein B [Elusimicrobia bacterium RIFCSPLOWO2_01_FULL_59_12]|nr:MAG: acriflavine resistance protein B [Elusimicrobia bacterium RIFCSPLOWO2_01_FULL_59_12]